MCLHRNIEVPPTKSITLPHLRPPTPHQIDMIPLIAGDLRIPPPHQLHILIQLIRLDRVKHNTMHILPPGQHLTETLLDLVVHLAALVGAVDELAQLAAAPGGFLARGGFAFLPCGRMSGQ